MYQPDIRPVTDTLYRLNEDYTYVWIQRNIVTQITVPKGFTYDGASVPRFLWSLSGLTRDGLIRAAALVHDWIYMNDGALPECSMREFNKGWTCISGRWTRKDSDKLFLKMMLEAGIENYRANRAYACVRLFGGLYW